MSSPVPLYRIAFKNVLGDTLLSAHTKDPVPWLEVVKRFHLATREAVRNNWPAHYHVIAT